MLIYMVYSLYTLCLFNIAIENGPFIDDFPIKTSIYKGFSMAMLNNQTVYIYIYRSWPSHDATFETGGLTWPSDSHQRFVCIEGTPTTDTRPGKHTTNYGKSPFYSWVDHGRSTISMAIVNSFLYVYQRVSWESDFSKLSCGWEIHSFLISHFFWGRWIQFQSCGKPNAINLPFRNSL